jgi:hypothetical protein
MNNNWKAVLGIMLVFVFGCLAGALCMSVVIGHRAIALLERGPDGVEEVLERRMTHNLVLDATQRKQVHELFMANLQQRKLLQKRIQPDVQALNRQTVQQVMAILNPDQKERFQANIDRLRKRLGAAANEEAPNPAAPATPATNSGAPTPPAQ